MNSHEAKDTYLNDCHDNKILCISQSKKNKATDIIKRTRARLQLKSRPKFDVRSTSVEDEESQREAMGWRRVAGRFNSLSI
ncbi:hypothetical protein ALC56_11224 [Trachymyrmex septentrionalis]|uniref:Uncharacterized protein n=1 Tax=Trachymyrmex septentrionalis TaxID=34720 RepID=A0A195F2C9_9HYME|nr:hypothetical protein ALC56_11224 [Trachymyrmex septentrionalis]